MGSLLNGGGPSSGACVESKGEVEERRVDDGVEGLLPGIARFRAILLTARAWGDLNPRPPG
jgi:hypothetical protein